MATLIVLETAPNAKKLAASIPRYSEMGHVVLRAAGEEGGGGGEDGDVGMAYLWCVAHLSRPGQCTQQTRVGR